MSNKGVTAALLSGVVLVGARSCDEVLIGLRGLTDDVGTTVGRSASDEIGGSGRHTSSLDNILKDESLNLNKRHTADDEMLALITRNADSLDLENTLPGERVHRSYVSSADDLIIDDSWFKAANEPKIVSLFPKNNEEYLSVYNKSPSVSAEAKMTSFYDDLSNESGLLPREYDQARQILNSIENSDGRPVVILAHSEDAGKTVVFPDGSKMDISEVHSHCISALKRCLVLTCKGEDFGLKENITAKDALNLWKAIRSKSTSMDSPTVDDLVEEARLVRFKQKAKKNIVLSWASATIIGSPYMIVSRQRDEDKSSGTRKRF